MNTKTKKCRKYQATLFIEIPVDGDLGVETGRMEAEKAIEQIRENIKYNSWPDSAPATMDEIICGRKHICINEEAAVCEKKDRYFEYLEKLDDEFLGYEYDDRCLSDLCCRVDECRDKMLNALLDWHEQVLFDDPKYIVDLEYA